MDKVLFTKDYRVENKKFFFDLKENPKGRYLRITESSGGRSAIVIPETGLETFCEILSSFLDNLKESSSSEEAPHSTPTTK